MSAIAAKEPDHSPFGPAAMVRHSISELFPRTTKAIYKSFGLANKEVSYLPERDQDEPRYYGWLDRLSTVHSMEDFLRELDVLMSRGIIAVGSYLNFSGRPETTNLRAHKGTDAYNNDK